MSTYWYAVSDVAKEYVFCVGQHVRPELDHVRLYLQDSGVPWAISRDLRLVSDSEDELEDELEKKYVQLELSREMLEPMPGWYEVSAGQALHRVVDGCPGKLRTVCGLRVRAVYGVRLVPRRQCRTCTPRVRSSR